MTTKEPLPPLEALKAEARRLRASLLDGESEMTQSAALEAVARQRGYRDWNTIRAAAENRPPSPPVSIGQTVSGLYLGQAFTAEVRRVSERSDDRFRITLQLQEPIDVVTFDSFSAYRSHLKANIKRDGETVERTSDGKPQLALVL